MHHTYSRGPTPVPGPENSTLDKGGLNSNVCKDYMMSLVESTHKLYVCGTRRYQEVCSAAEISPIPATEF